MFNHSKWKPSNFWWFYWSTNVDLLNVLIFSHASSITCWVTFQKVKILKGYQDIKKLTNIESTEMPEICNPKKQNCLLLLLVVAWKNRLFMIRCVWIRPHYNSRSKILKFSKWKYYRWWSIRAPLILLHPNHPYSSNPIPPKSSSLSLSLFTNRIIINSLEVNLY